MTDARTLAVADCSAALVDAFRARKDDLGLSDAVMDELGGLASGHSSKILTQTKGFGSVTLDILLKVLCLRLVVVEDMDQLRRMESRYDRREDIRIQVNANRLASTLLKRAKPHILREMSMKGVEARKLKTDKVKQSQIGRHAARVRWGKARAKRRSGRAGSAPAAASQSSPAQATRRPRTSEPAAD